MSVEKLHNILTGFCQMKEKERNKEERGRKRARDLLLRYDFNLHG